MPRAEKVSGEALRWSRLAAGNTTLILAVLVSLFVGSEFNHGTMKLIASRQYNRLTIYSSKLIAAMAAGPSGAGGRL